MRTNEAAGGVVVGPDKKIVIVAQYGNSWCLPKGGIEEGETTLEAAVREVGEEAGITDLVYVCELGAYERLSIAPGGVGESDAYGSRLRTFFLFTTKQSELKPQNDPDNATTQARWVTIDECIALLTHPKDKEFLANVRSKVEAVFIDKVVAIEEVQRATEAAMAAVLDYLRTTAEPTSEEAHALIDRVLEERGCESPKGHIVAAGVQGFEPHEHGSGPVPRGEPVVIDIYPRSKTTGYFADMTRTVCLGEPSQKVRQMYDAVLGAHKLAVSLVRPGAQCKDIQDAVEKFFADKGFETSGQGTQFAFREGFVHGVGHGVSRTLHDAPSLGRKSTGALTEGEVITIEPGLYYEDVGGVRIEDMVLVTKDGCRNLTNCPKDLEL